MPPLTTGFNSTTQANEILEALRDALAAGTTVTRGPLWALPERTCLVLTGPGVETTPLGLNVEEARYEWMIVSVRAVADNDRRADELDTLADTIMAALMDLMRTSTSFSYQSGDGPRRLRDMEMAELAERQPRLDPLGIVFYTRTEVNPPC